MKVVLIDDEKAMHLIMKRMLAKVPDIEIVGSFMETATAFSYLAKHEVDLIFVDISMPRENGLEFAERLRESGQQTKLVFITSHKEYALLAFDVYAFDYILKPVNQDRLRHTIQRVRSAKHSEIVQAEQEPSVSRAVFNCLGGIDIQITYGETVKWKSSKSVELFGYLLLHKGRRVSRARLTEDIFAGMPQKNAETYLNTTVYQLRKLLETYGLKENLHSDSNHYALHLNHVRVDLLSFEEGCKQMADIDDANIVQALELEQLYVGDLFGDRVFLWARSEIERLSLMYTSFAKRLCGALIRAGEHQAAIRLLKKLLAYNELDEEPLILLMKALALQKNKEDLMTQYSQFTENLHKEMGLTPSLEASTLYMQLLSELDS